VIRQALPDELAVRRGLRRRSTFAAGQQRLFAYDGSRDDRAPHPVRSSMRIAPVGQTCVQAPQPMHSSAGRVKSK